MKFRVFSQVSETLKALDKSSKDLEKPMTTLKQIGVNAVSLGEEKRREATGIELQALSGPAISGLHSDILARFLIRGVYYCIILRAF